MSINRFIVMGHLGADPEIRHTPKGEPVASVRVATNHTYTDRNTGEIKKVTEWHRLVAFGKRAEIIGKFCGQGDKVYFESFHRTRKFVDQEKHDRFLDEFVITFVELTTKRGDVADPGDDDHGGTAGDEGANFRAV